MKKVNEIMESLGFKDGADDSVKAAFVQNLIYQAYGVKVEVPTKYKPAEAKKSVTQLSFDLEDAG